MTNPGNDNIDQQLKDAGSRWQLPAELETLSIDDVRIHRANNPFRGRLAVLAVAATVAAITATAVLLSNNTNNHSSTTAAAASHPSITARTSTSTTSVPAVIATAAKISESPAVSSEGASKVTDYPGLPQNAGPLANGPASSFPARPLTPAISAAWTRTHQLAIVLRGGSSCYPTVTSLTEIGPQQLQIDSSITLPDQATELPGVVGGCPAVAEFAPHTAVWKPPANLNVHQPVVISFEHQDQIPDYFVTLPGL